MARTLDHEVAGNGLSPYAVLRVVGGATPIRESRCVQSRPPAPRHSSVHDLGSRESASFAVLKS